MIARRTPGFTGADLANLVNEAALLAARREKQDVSSEEFEQAIDRIIAGLEKKNRVLNEKKSERWHITRQGTLWWLHFALLRKLSTRFSIVPRGIGGSGIHPAVADRRSLPDVENRTTGENRRPVGRTGAEIIIFQDVTTGAQNDLQRATEIAHSMVTLYGMTDQLGPVTYRSHRTRTCNLPVFLPSKETSEDTAKMIDHEVRTIIESRMQAF